MSNEFAVAAMGEDGPGIVAAMTRALALADVSVEDSSMTILGGHFAMLLLVQGDVDVSQLTDAVQPVADRLGLLLEVRSTRHHARAGERDDYTIAAYGPDRPGLVAALASVLGDAGVNITDFGSRVGERGLFSMWFNVTIPFEVDADELATRLREVGGEVSLDVTVARVDAEAL